MSNTGEAIILAVFILSTSIWIGGYVAIVVVARTATSTLEPANRVAFFRSLGRSYLWVGAPALVVALATGGVLARNQDVDGLMIAIIVVAAVLVVSFAVAVDQARRMTRLRRRLIGTADDEKLAISVRRGAQRAGTLRAVLGLLSVALVVLGAFVAT